jgi:hypothetical protein
MVNTNKNYARVGKKARCAFCHMTIPNGLKRYKARRDYGVLGFLEFERQTRYRLAARNCCLPCTIRIINQQLDELNEKVSLMKKIKGAITKHELKEAKNEMHKRKVVEDL